MTEGEEIGLRNIINAVKEFGGKALSQRVYDYLTKTRGQNLPWTTFYSRIRKLEREGRLEITKELNGHQIRENVLVLKEENGK